MMDSAPSVIKYTYLQEVKGEIQDEGNTLGHAFRLCMVEMSNLTSTIFTFKKCLHCNIVRTNFNF